MNTKPLVLGRIVWAEIADSNGIPKLRPAVILTPTAQILPGKALNAVAITSRLPQILPDDHVLLPWHAQGHPRTGLNRRCAAVCTWLARINETDIQSLGGVVPTPIMADILTKAASLQTREQTKAEGNSAEESGGEPAETDTDPE
jgi:hypothetical protein